MQGRPNDLDVRSGLDPCEDSVETTVVADRQAYIRTYAHEIEAQQAQLRMIPGYLDRASELERTNAVHREDLERHKQALAALLAENESLRLALAQSSSANQESTP